jgi:hypothetical protein
VTATRNGRPRPGGPVPKLTPEVHEKIIDVVAAGCAMETAAAYAGVNTWTFRDWLRRGRAELKEHKHNRYTRLVEAIEEARARTEMVRVARIAKAGQDGDWKADAWWLEHALQDKYAVIRQKLEGTIKLQAQPMIDPSKGTVEELQELRRLLALFAPDADDPALSETQRPALELVEGEDFEEVQA